MTLEDKKSAAEAAEAATAAEATTAAEAATAAETATAAEAATAAETEATEDAEVDEADMADDDYSLPLSARRERPGYVPPVKKTAPPPPPRQFRKLPPDEGFSPRALVEGAMLVALSLLLAAVGTYVPILSLLGLLLYPLPMAVLTMRRGVRVGIVATVALLALSALFFGLPQAVMMLLQYGALGVFLGWCFRVGRRPLFTFVLSALISALGAAAGVMLSLLISGLPIDALAAEGQEMVRSIIDVYEKQGLLEQLIPQGWSVEQYVEYMSSTMMRLLPAVLILASALMTALCYLCAAAVLRRLGYEVAKLPPLREWRLDWRMVWGVMLGLIFLLYGRYAGADWASTVGMSILYVFAPLLVIGGAAFLLWYLHEMGASPVLRGCLLFVVIMLFSLTVWFLLVLAVLDDLLDLRGRLTRLRERQDGNK